MFLYFFAQRRGMRLCSSALVSIMNESSIIMRTIVVRSNDISLITNVFACIHEIKVVWIFCIFCCIWCDYEWLWGRQGNLLRGRWQVKACTIPTKQTKIFLYSSWSEYFVIIYTRTNNNAWYRVARIHTVTTTVIIVPVIVHGRNWTKCAIKRRWRTRWALCDRCVDIIPQW